MKLNFFKYIKSKKPFLILFKRNIIKLIIKINWLIYRLQSYKLLLKLHTFINSILFFEFSFELNMNLKN